MEAVVSAPATSPLQDTPEAALSALLQCPICHSQIKSPVINTLPGCGHAFCSSCINYVIEHGLRKGPENEQKAQKKEQAQRTAPVKFQCPICSAPAFKWTLRSIPILTSFLKSYAEFKLAEERHMESQAQLQSVGATTGAVDKSDELCRESTLATQMLTPQRGTSTTVAAHVRTVPRQVEGETSDGTPRLAKRPRDNAEDSSPVRRLKAIFHSDSDVTPVGQCVEATACQRSSDVAYECVRQRNEHGEWDWRVNLCDPMPQCATSSVPCIHLGSQLEFVESATPPFQETDHEVPHVPPTNEDAVESADVMALGRGSSAEIAVIPVPAATQQSIPFLVATGESVFDSSKTFEPENVSSGRGELVRQASPAGKSTLQSDVTSASLCSVPAKIVIRCDEGLSVEDQWDVHRAAKQLGGAAVLTADTPIVGHSAVTHVVCALTSTKLVGQASCAACYAIVRGGIWVVDVSWIKQSLILRRWVGEADHEALGTSWRSGLFRLARCRPELTAGASAANNCCEVPSLNCLTNKLWAITEDARTADPMILPILKQGGGTLLDDILRSLCVALFNPSAKVTVPRSCVILTATAEKSPISALATNGTLPSSDKWVRASVEAFVRQAAQGVVLRGECEALGREKCVDEAIKCLLELTTEWSVWTTKRLLESICGGS